MNTITLNNHTHEVVAADVERHDDVYMIGLQLNGMRVFRIPQEGQLYLPTLRDERFAVWITGWRHARTNEGHMMTYLTATTQPVPDMI